ALLGRGGGQGLLGRRNGGIPSRGLEVCGEAVAATLAAVAGLLVAAEGARGVEAVEGVRPDDARAQLVGNGEDAAALLAPDAGGEAVGRVVGLRDRLRGRAEGQHREDRAEDLVAGDAVALRDAREDGRREPESLLRQLARGRPALGTLLLADRAEFPDALELLAGVDGADIRVLVERVAHPKG